MRAFLAVLGWALGSAAVLAETRTTFKNFIPDASAFMRSYGTAAAPHGFVDFCRRHAEHCRPHGTPDRMPLTAERLDQLEAVNRWVNEVISPIKDRDVYGIDEFWVLPVDKGDCEDYALLKRKLLIAQGWPTGALLLTVVRDEHGEGHAVLTARTNFGDVILDNKIAELRFWQETHYHFLSRQSDIDPQHWVSLEAGSGQPPSQLAGVEGASDDSGIDMTFSWWAVIAAEGLD